MSSRFFLSCLLSVLLISTAALSRAEELRIGLSADVTSIDPHWNASGPDSNIATHIFEPLIGSDKNGRIFPLLATSWRAIDPLTWEFKLRQGVKFHDGSPLTAEDVLFSLERPLKLAGNPGSYTSYVRSIIAKEIIDPYTIRLKTATPRVLVPYDLNSIFIVSKKAALNAIPADFDSGKAAIGTGPYKLAAFKRSDRIELIRNDQYWNTEQHPVWDKVSFRLLTNDTSRLTALLAGEVDAIENIPTQDIAKLRSNPKFTVAQQVSWRTIFWHLDQYRDQSPYITDKNGQPLKRNPFKDARVRLAISKAIYRDAIVSRIMEGMALPGSNLVSPGIFGHNPDIPVEAYDREGARKLLAEAGYPDGFGLTLHAPNNRYVNDSKIAQAVATMLSRIGIQTKVQTLPWSIYLGKARAGEFSFMLIGWGSLLGDNTLRAHLATVDEKKGNGTWNFSRYSNPEVDRLLDQNFTLFDDAQREALTRKIMALAMQDNPVIVMHHQLASWAMRKGITYPGRVDEYTLAFQFVRQ